MIKGTPCVCGHPMLGKRHKESWQDYSIQDLPCICAHPMLGKRHKHFGRITRLKGLRVSTDTLCLAKGTQKILTGLPEAALQEESWLEYSIIVCCAGPPSYSSRVLREPLPLFSLQSHSLLLTTVSHPICRGTTAGRFCLIHLLCCIS